MPTAAKLVAAICFGFVAWFGAELVIPHLPAGTRVHLFPEITALLGALAGWTMSGAHAGSGPRAGIGYGLTSVALTVFWALLVFSGEEMLDRSIHLRYDGAIAALKEMVKIFIEYARLMAQPDVIAWLVLGALFGGLMTEISARKWS